jgi:hypothetical protein
MSNFSVIESAELSRVTGGVSAAEWTAIGDKAKPYCPSTVAKYSKVDPSTLTRGKAEQMGNSCLAEMGPFKATFAKGQITGAIDQAFPK